MTAKNANVGNCKASLSIAHRSSILIQVHNMNRILKAMGSLMQSTPIVARIFTTMVDHTLPLIPYNVQDSLRVDAIAFGKAFWAFVLALVIDSL